MESLTEYKAKRFKRIKYISILKFKRKYQLPDGLVLRLIENKVLHSKRRLIIIDSQYWKIIGMIKRREFDDAVKKKMRLDFITTWECSRIFKRAPKFVTDACRSGYVTSASHNTPIMGKRARIMIIKIDFFLIEYIRFHVKLELSEQEISDMALELSISKLPLPNVLPNSQS